MLLLSFEMLLKKKYFALIKNSSSIDNCLVKYW